MRVKLYDMMFLIIILFKKKIKKISILNTAIMTLNAIMPKNLYFGLMMFHTHDFLIKA
jgi:hypothetical protein